MLGIKTFLKRTFNKHFFYPYVWEPMLDRRVKALRQKKAITVAFVTMDVAMWKYQGLYDLLRQDKRFRLYVVISPSVKFSRDQQIRDAQRMRDYFKQHSMPFVDWDIEHGAKPTDIKKTLNPDILFYTQPGQKVFTTVHSFQHFRDKLVCYTPYGFYMHKSPYQYNRPFTRMAWKLYYHTETHKRLAEQHADNRGRNVVVSGYPAYDQYADRNFEDTWKIKDRRVKRIVWAPHFTIAGAMLKGSQARSHFLTMAEPMLRLAQKYEGKIQIAFKPHPRLLTELYRHPDWGKQRADAYYEQWQNLSNGQLETGLFVDLFHFSDALIHDSSSFVIDYVFFKKPEFFICDDLGSFISESDDISRMIYRSVYHGATEREITAFIDNVVIGGNDPFKETREHILKQYLLPPNGRTASENIYADLCKELF